MTEHAFTTGFTVDRTATEAFAAITDVRGWWSEEIDGPLSLLVTSVSDDRQRARVLGLNGALLSGGFTVGALVGGAVVDVLSWRWAFLVNVPVAVLILVATPFVVPAGRVEPGLVYLMTLYLQEVLHFAPLTTGLVFGVPGLASVAAGVIAGRVIGRHGPRSVLAVGLLVQAGLTAPLVLLGTGDGWLAVLIPALFLGFFGPVTAIVAFMVTATSGLPDSEQGLATGLATLTQQVGLTIGVPILGGIAASQAILLDGIHLALTVDVAVTVVAVALVWTCPRPRPRR